MRFRALWQRIKGSYGAGRWHRRRTKAKEIPEREFDAAKESFQFTGAGFDLRLWSIEGESSDEFNKRVFALHTADPTIWGGGRRSGE